MAITVYNVKKWIKMLRGKSIAHVNQNLGKSFSKDEVKGYYNNLTEKVTFQPDLLGTDKLPYVPDGKGGSVLFPVAVFQYGLGSYDLYLQTKEDKYLEKFRQCCEWTFENQLSNGAWDNFSFSFPEYPYGAMCLGEAASLLIRGYKEFGRNEYLTAAKKAIDFMLLPIEDGGTTLYRDDDVVLMEYTTRPLAPVLNGWIFAWWGLYDYVVITKNSGDYKSQLDKSCKSIIKYLPLFSTRYWSKYNDGKLLASPFYHRLHVAQMQAMFELTGEQIFLQFANRWEHQHQNPICKSYAFLIKAIQKIKE